jgi:hypothetical protein
MSGETNLSILIKSMQPMLQEGDYVFASVKDIKLLNLDEVLFYFREKEEITVVIKREYADVMKLSYNYISAWITLNIHSSLEAVGLTAAFAGALAQDGISCNVVAAFYHDNIFVARTDAVKAMESLLKLSAKPNS